MYLMNWGQFENLFLGSIPCSGHGGDLSLQDFKHFNKGKTFNTGKVDALYGLS